MWLLLIVLACIDVGCLITVGRSIFALVHAKGILPSTWEVLRFFVKPAGFFVLFLTLLRGLWLRRRWARWFALLLLAMAFSILGWNADDTAYANDAQRAGGALMNDAIAPALLAWWIWVLGFSAKGRRHFGLQPIRTLQRLPPEPR